jgi:hypothetical protein
LALALFSSSSDEWFAAAAGPELTIRSAMPPSPPARAGRAGKPRRHPLILDGLCLHVLSSFQRTERRPPRLRPSSGEPCEVTTASIPCQPPVGSGVAPPNR